MLKLVPKDHKLSLFFKLGLVIIKERKVEFELKEKRKIIIGRNLSRLHSKEAT